MRIIDADALKRQFRKRELERSGYYINGADIYTIRKIINGTPTIEERPQGECDTCRFYGKRDMCSSCMWFYGDMYAPCEKEVVRND